MTTQQRAYIDAQLAKLDEYVDAVTTGAVLTNEDVRLAVERYKRDRLNTAYDFRIDKLEKFFGFLTYIRINQDNKYVTFNPEPFQVFYLCNIYGFYIAGTDDRRFTTSFLSISRKAGKSTIACVQALYHLVSDGILDAQVFCISDTRELAGNALKIAKDLVSNSPALKKRVRNLHYSLRYQTDKSNNFLKSMTGDPEKLNSIRPAFAIIDETHLFSNSELPDMLKSGQVGVKSPLMSMISTRGFLLDGFQYNYEKYLKRVLRQETSDESTFIMMFGLDNIDEIYTPEMWIKSNPSLSNPKILKLKELTDLFEQKRYSLAGLANFITLNLNMFYESSDVTFIPKEVLDEVFVEEHDESLLLGEDCYLSFDLSATKDITSISLMFTPTDSHPEFIFKNINIKTNSVEKRVRSNGYNLTEHIEKGELIELQTDTIDYEYIFNIIAELSEKYNIMKVGYDPWNSALLTPKLKNDLGLECIPVRQNTAHLSFPTKYIEKLIHDKSVIIDNSLNKWMFGNVRLYFDTNGNCKPMKPTKGNNTSIDGVIAMLNCLSVYLRDIDEDMLSYEGVSI